MQFVKKEEKMQLYLGELNLFLNSHIRKLNIKSVQNTNFHVKFLYTLFF